MYSRIFGGLGLHAWQRIPLPEDFHSNFGGDPFTGDTPDYLFKRHVLATYSSFKLSILMLFDLQFHFCFRILPLT